MTDLQTATRPPTGNVVWPEAETGAEPRGLAGGPKSGRTLPALVAVPAFLLVLLAAYGFALGLSQALRPVDDWLETRLVKPSAQAGVSSATALHAARHDGP